MKPRLVTSVSALALVAAMTTGCLPQPSPEPTPAFASEEEAFAAAEATYRAYVDALNEVDLSDPETFEGVYAWTTGDANANERQTLSQMHADGWTVTGTTKIDLFDGREFDAKSSHVVAIVCSNVAEIEVVDSTGASMVGADRPDVYALEVRLVPSGTSTGLSIERSNAIEDKACN
ncbi:hypothetical protein [Microbacterium sp. 4R-513]|uniref:hypothetical protein n=1 Tax=Microbacterium sp. 4R-513 TaxID=2567934 RepID=UPI001F49DCED|nr:hypothetical protein [Microbacterium sp. 4R-513]